MRLDGKVAVVVGAGQTPGDTIGNGRATALLFAREGAQVIAVDRDLDSARETEAIIRAEGGEATAHRTDITEEAQCQALAAACSEIYGRVDVLHNNVGIGGGDTGAVHLDEAVWRRIFDVNLTAMFLTCKHVFPVMRAGGGGSVVNISSIASICATPTFAYKVSKAGVNALTEQLAMANARYGIRVNAILPGLMETPMAIKGISQGRGISEEELIEQRNAQVPLGRKMGTGWDVAYAALFLASDESKFITGVLLPVDGGQSVRRG